MTTFKNGKLYGTIWERVARTNGTVQVIREDDGKLVVEHSDLYRVYSRVDGFRTVKQAIAEAKCYA